MVTSLSDVLDEQQGEFSCCRVLGTGTGSRETSRSCRGWMGRTRQTVRSLPFWAEATGKGQQGRKRLERICSQKGGTGQTVPENSEKL